MSEFSFEPELSPQANIERFYKYLEKIDQEMTQVFRANIDKLLPLPADSQGRTSARIAFNAAVADALAKLEEKVEGNAE